MDTPRQPLVEAVRSQCHAHTQRFTDRKGMTSDEIVSLDVVKQKNLD